MSNFNNRKSTQQSVLDMQASANAVAVARVQTAYEAQQKSGSSSLKQARPFSSGHLQKSPSRGSQPKLHQQDRQLNKTNSALQTSNQYAILEKRKINRTRPISHYQMKSNQRTLKVGNRGSRMGTLANITTITDTQSYKTLENQNTLKTRVKQNVFNQLIYNQDSGKDLHGI